MNDILKGKKALILGLASDKSIAYGIADQFHRQGAELALTYANDRFKPRVEKFADEFGATITHPCDVTSDDEINALFEHIQTQWDHVDIIVHAVAFAERALLEGSYISNLNRAGFSQAHDVSSYSLAAVVKAATPLLKNSSIMTLSYIGAHRAVPNYNVMGVAKASLEANVRYLAYALGPEGHRVNAISAGPIKTLSASGIKGFKDMLAIEVERNPMRRLTTIDDVGHTAVFLGSDMANAITGEVIYVDQGAHIL